MYYFPGSSYTGYNNNNDNSNKNCDNPYQSNNGYDYSSGGYNINNQRNPYGNSKNCQQTQGSSGSSYSDNSNNRDYSSYQQTGYDRNGKPSQ